jgi:hypothetical protein
MKTKYGGEISNVAVAEYFEMLIGKIYKTLPMFEDSNCLTLDSYLFSLLKELCGGSSLLEDKYFVELIANLESLFFIDNQKKFKSQVFKCTNLCRKICDRLKGVE